MDNETVSIIIQTSLTFLATLCATTPSVLALFFMAWQLSESRKQTRQSDQILKTNMYNEIINTEREIWMGMLANDPKLCEWWLKNEYGFHNVKSAQKNKQSLFIILRIGFYENLFYQKKIGTLSSQAWKVWENEMKETMKSPPYREVWTMIGHWYMEEFQHFFSEIGEN